jgi:hypothetical protein
MLKRGGFMFERGGFMLRGGGFMLKTGASIRRPDEARHVPVSISISISISKGTVPLQGELMLRGGAWIHAQGRWIHASEGVDSGSKRGLGKPPG